MTWGTVQYTGRSGRDLLHYTIEDDTVCCRHVLFATLVPITCILSVRYYGKCLQRETGYLKMTVKRRDRDKQWTDNTQS